MKIIKDKFKNFMLSYTPDELFYRHLYEEE